MVLDLGVRTGKHLITRLQPNMPIARSTTNPNTYVESLGRSKNGEPTVIRQDMSNGGLESRPPAYVPGMSAADVYENRYQGPSGRTGPYYQAASAAKHMAENKGENPIHSLYEKGPLVSAGVGALGGLLGARVLNNMYIPEEFHKGTSILIPALAAGLTWVGSRIYNRDMNAPAYTPMRKSGHAVMYKESAMYQDARNFILEKLQGASDISSVEKATLAAKIRSMSTGEAERLKSTVRAAVGFGIGRLIARFFFGARGAGSFVGGAVGALTSLIAGAVRNNAPNSMFQGSQYY